MFCNQCGGEITPGTAFCAKCGASTGGAQPGPATPPSPEAPPPGWSAPPPSAGAPAPRNKLVAALLGIFVGAFGVHRFYLGYTAIGIIQLILGILGIVTCGITTLASAVWGLIEGILILTGSINKDAQGRPLVD